MLHQCAEMERLKEQKSVMLAQQCPEPSVAHLSVPTFQLELFVAKLQASAQRDQNVERVLTVVNWYVPQDKQRKLELSVEEEDSFRERPAKLMVLAPNSHLTPRKNEEVHIKFLCLKYVFVVGIAQ